MCVCVRVRACVCAMINVFPVTLVFVPLMFINISLLLQFLHCICISAENLVKSVSPSVCVCVATQELLSTFSEYLVGGML